MFNYRARRARYHPVTRPWIDAHPGSLRITPYSIRQDKSNLQRAMANPDVGWEDWLKAKAKL